MATWQAVGDKRRLCKIHIDKLLANRSKESFGVMVLYIPFKYLLADPVGLFVTNK